ncbi:MAG: hypothetical protein Solivirus2_61 [Solivirus sp.]|uniref:Uncharacterized protein n=1 Tax=Solivirus sp. TaxID=2487772 RepID=A0A3G5AFM6_9VIRU|nr:MAG: hypothetical protein Solivirus2_61 [Solivirus sp.]
MTTLPIAINDYVLDVEDDTYILYRIHEICLIDIDNEPTSITREKRDKVDIRLKIVIEIAQDKYNELELRGDYWNLNSRPVIFLRETLIDQIEEYREIESLAHYNNIPEHLKPLLKSEDFWSTKLMNDFSSIKNFHVMCAIKPILMTWHCFYEHFAVNLEMMLEISERNKEEMKSSIFDPIWKFLRRD